jgi:hypothetical protein
MAAAGLERSLRASPVPKGGEPVKKLSIRKLEVIKTTAALYALGCNRVA